MDEARPPRSSPPMAPIQVKRRHQIPSSSSGQNVEAAMAKAHPTSTLMEMLSTARPSAVMTMPMAMAEVRNARTPPPMMSCDSAPDMLISSPDEVERKAAKAPAATSAPRTMPRLPGRHDAGQDQHHRVGLARRVEAGRLHPAQHGEDRREDVEAAEQEQHERGGAAGRLAVAVGVEADQDVGESHGSQHGGQQDPVGGGQRVDPAVHPAAGAGRSTPAPLMTGLPSTCGACAPAGNVSVAPDVDGVRPLVSSSGPCRSTPVDVAGRRSTPTAAVTEITSDCGNCTAVRCVNVGGAAPVTSRPAGAGRRPGG